MLSSSCKNKLYDLNLNFCLIVLICVKVSHWKLVGPNSASWTTCWILVLTHDCFSAGSLLMAGARLNRNRVTWSRCSTSCSLWPSAFFLPYRTDLGDSYSSSVGSNSSASVTSSSSVLSSCEQWIADGSGCDDANDVASDVTACIMVSHSSLTLTCCCTTGATAPWSNRASFCRTSSAPTDDDRFLCTNSDIDPGEQDAVVVVASATAMPAKQKANKVSQNLGLGSVFLTDRLNKDGIFYEKKGKSLNCDLGKRVWMWQSVPP